MQIIFQSSSLRLSTANLGGTKVYIEANIENKQKEEQSNTPLGIILDGYSNS